jgi:hypothetical protein
MTNGQVYIECVECGKPLDGESRFWCREHYVSLGQFTITLSQEILDRAAVGRMAFENLLKKTQKEMEHGGR